MIGEAPGEGEAARVRGSVRDRRPRRGDPACLWSGEHLLSPKEVVEAARFMDRRRREDREAQQLLEALTPREKEVLQALADGLSDKDLARKLHVNIDTVHTHMGNIRRKLEVASRLQALVFAVRHDAVKV